MHFIKKISLLLIVLILTGCSNRLNEDKFILVYTDLIIAQDTLGAKFKLDEVKKDVFKKHNVTDREYENTLKYYNSEPKKWEAFFNKSIAYLESKRAKKKN
jgi:hypothetical protein